MFDSFIKRKADVLEHWIAFAEDFQHSPTEFYDSLEKELTRLKVPGLTMSRIEFAEGGILSDKRIYLRMLRERLVFDVCAAPFGTRFFFSCRTAEIPPVIQLWQLAVVFFGGLVIAGLAWHLLGFVFGSLVLAFGFVALIYILRNAVAIGLRDLDTTLIHSPVFGPIYERWFRAETYYRHDTRLMYLDTVSNVVRTLADEVTGTKGIKLIRQYETAPILGELYRPVFPREPKAPAALPQTA